MYLDHFKLSVPPFQFTTSPSELFMSSTHREGLAALEWGLLHEPSGLTLLAGDTGLGKTTLVCTLLSRRYQQVRTAYLGNPKLEYPELLASILNQLGIRGGRSSKGAMLTALVEFANDLASNQRIAIIADEAQALSDDALEEFRLLSNLERKGCKALQIILVGHPELLRRLASSDLRHLNERISARAILTPLNRKESHDYIEHRLRTAKANVRQVFKSRALDYVVDHAGGVPRRINALCHNAMLLAYSSDSKQVAMPMAKTAVAEYDNLHILGAHNQTLQKRRFLFGSWSLMRSILALGFIGAGGFAAAHLALYHHAACRLRSLGSSLVNRAPGHFGPSSMGADPAELQSDEQSRIDVGSKSLIVSWRSDVAGGVSALSLSERARVRAGEGSDATLRSRSE